MGTSVNQSSPKTLSWKVVQSGYRDHTVPVARVAAEVWRAALNQPPGNLVDLLAQPIVAELGALIFRSQSASEVARSAAHLIAKSKQSSLGADIARRAAVQSMTSSERVRAYTVRVFAEATSYLVSRDLPGHVGKGRARTVADSLALKIAIDRHVAGIVNSIAPRRN